MLPGQSLDFGFIANAARRRAALLIAPPIIGLFAALIVSARLPDMYEAETLMRLIPQRVPDSYVRSTVVLPISNRLESVSREVLSYVQIEQLITEFDLYPVERASQPMQDVVARMRAAVTVEMVVPPRGQTADAFHIRFKYADPALAAQVTDRLGSLFVEENARDRGNLANATNEFLEAQLADARKRLEAQEQRLESFRQRHSGSLPSQLDSNSEAVHNAQMQVQALVESMARDRDRKLMLERIYREAEAEPLPVPPSAQPTAAVPTTPTALSGTSQQQLELARANLAALEMRLKPEHPDIRRAKRQIDDLEKRVAQEAAQASAPQQAGANATAAQAPRSQVVTPEAALRSERLRQMRAELESLDRQLAFKEGEERRVRDTIAEYQRRIDASPALESEWSVLNRDYETLQNTYKELLGKSEQSKVAADLEKQQIGEQFRVVDLARVPNAPVSPVRLQINAIGLGLGLLIGVALAGLLEMMDTSFRTRGDLMDALSLPVLARIPLVETEAEQRARHRRRLMTSSAVMVLVVSGAVVFWAMRLWKYVV